MPRFTRRMIGGRRRHRGGRRKTIRGGALLFPHPNSPNRRQSTALTASYDTGYGESSAPLVHQYGNVSYGYYDDEGTYHSPTLLAPYQTVMIGAGRRRRRRTHRKKHRKSRKRTRHRRRH